MRKSDIRITITAVFCCLSCNVSLQAQISPEMKGIIKEMEKLSTVVYMDGLYRAVGYGHRITDRDIEWVRDLELYDEITPAAADLLFELDMLYLVQPGLVTVRREIGADYPQNVYDVMGSLIYNMGLGSLRRTEFYRLFRERKYKQAFMCLPVTKAGQPGLAERRRRELTHLLRNFDMNLLDYRRP